MTKLPATFLMISYFLCNGKDTVAMPSSPTSTENFSTTSLSQYPFEVLYAFISVWNASSTSYILEIKRTDLPADVPKSHRFGWFIYDVVADVANKLTFRSMADGERSFVEGVLQFDTREGSYYPRVGGEIQLSNISENRALIQTPVLAAVQKFVKDSDSAAQ